MVLFLHKFFKKLFPFDLTFTARIGNQCLGPVGFILYRFLMFSLMVTNFVLVEMYSHQADFLYFTFWGLILSLVTFTFMIFQTIVSKIIHREWTTKLWRISHFLFSLTLVIELFLNGVFWFGMFPVAMIKLWGKVSALDIFVNISEHAVPLILLIVDLHMNYVVLWNYAYTLFHTIFLFVYLGINMSYTLNQPKPVYPLITWKNLLSYVFLVACALAIPLCHFLIIQYCKFCKRKVIQIIVNENQSLGSIIPMTGSPYSTFSTEDKVSFDQISGKTVEN